MHYYKKSSMNSLTDYITALPTRRYFVNEVNERINSNQTFYLACIENENQLEILKNHKCNFIQGFVWGKPLDYDSAVKLCKGI